MPKVELPFEALLEATETLSALERDTLAHHLGRVEEKQERDWTKKVDAILVSQINDSVPLPGDVTRLRELRELNNEGTISTKEHEEYMRLAARIEQAGVQRLKFAIELAKLREIPPTQLIDEMQLFPTR